MEITGTETVEEPTQYEPAEAVADEATGKKRTITFGEGPDALTLDVPRKWQRFKFMRALSRGDIATALDSVWRPVWDAETGGYVDHPAIAQIEELEITDEEFQSAMERLGEAIGGIEPGN